MALSFLLALGKAGIADCFLQIEAANKLLLVAEFEALKVEQIPTGIYRNKRTAEHVEIKVGSVVDARLIAGIALIGQHSVGRIEGHHVAAEICLVAETDKAPTEGRIDVQTVHKTTIVRTAVAIPREDISSLQTEAIEGSKIREIDSSKRIDHNIIHHAEHLRGMAEMIELRITAGIEPLIAEFSATHKSERLAD